MYFEETGGIKKQHNNCDFEMIYFHIFFQFSPLRITYCWFYLWFYIFYLITCLFQGGMYVVLWLKSGGKTVYCNPIPQTPHF